MTAMLRARYGASPLHLLGHLSAFAIAAYALAQVFAGGVVENFLIWFVGAALLHDLVFLPLYSLLDLVARHGVHHHRRRPGVPAINHVRVPALLSGLLLLVYFPLVLGEAPGTYMNATGHAPVGYARNWLLITAALFTASALSYAVRLRGRSTGARPRPGP
jgi:hypothetical protein